MNRNLLCNFYRMLGIALLLGVCGIQACSSNSTVVRIKTDKSSPRDKGKSGAELTDQMDQPMNQAIIQNPMEQKLDREEMVGTKANEVLNFLVKAEELLSEGNLPAAEKQLVLASGIIESKEILAFLIEIYDQTGKKAKADSCRAILTTRKQTDTGTSSQKAPTL
jgi:hypothetical protein